MCLPYLHVAFFGDRFATNLFLKPFLILLLWNDFSACDFRFKLKMMLSHFATTDEIVFLFGNGKATSCLCLFVQNLHLHNVSKIAGAEIGVRPTPISALAKGVDQNDSLFVNHRSTNQSVPQRTKFLNGSVGPLSAANQITTFIITNITKTSVTFSQRSRMRLGDHPLRKPPPSHPSLRPRCTCSSSILRYPVSEALFSSSGPSFRRTLSSPHERFS